MAGQKPFLEGTSLSPPHHTSRSWYPTETFIGVSMMTQDAFVLVGHLGVLVCVMPVQVFCPALRLGCLSFSYSFIKVLYIFWT